MFPLTQSVFAGGIVSLSVGPDAFPIDAHIELLCASSPFFDKALDGRFVEAETKHISLPDEDPKVFSEFLSWIYSGKVSFEDGTTSFTELCQVWVLADKFQVPELQNHVMAILAKKCASRQGSTNLSHLVISYVYDNTIETSPLRCALVDISVWGMEISKFSKNCAAYPREFVEDFAIQQGRKASGMLPADLPLVKQPSAYFVKILEPVVKKDGDREGTANEKAVASTAETAESLHSKEETDVLNQTPMPHRRKLKMATGVRSASRTASPMSPGVGEGASSSSPVPGTPTPPYTASPSGRSSSKRSGAFGNRSGD